MSFPKKIVSGGQTGADRAALDFAIERGIEHGGWCPKGRRAEDAPLDERYQLRETPKRDYLQRNEWNVRDSDATVVFTLAAEITGGSLETVRFANKLRKPYVHIHRSLLVPSLELRMFLEGHEVKTLNVAGSRESKEPGLYEWVKQTLLQALKGEVAATS